MKLAESLQLSQEVPSGPDQVSISLAAALVLGLRPGRFYRDVKLGCINLLLTYPDGCRANCAYCGLSRSRPVHLEERSFIRVEWPVVPTEEILDRIAKYEHELTRVCVSMTTHPQAYQDLAALCQRLAARTSLPLSALVTPTLLDEARLRELRAIGVDMVGVGLDAASQRVFSRLRGKAVQGPHTWERYWRILELARDVFGPWKVSCHLIVGIGERDEELIETFSRLRDMQVCSHLFSFYPEPESAMARRRRPSLTRWRRVQLSRYLIEKGMLEPHQIRLDAAGRIHGWEVSPSLLEEATDSGLPFLTGGCPGSNGEVSCTRPFGSYRPGQPFRDFPFLPTERDLAKVRRELRF